MKDKTKRKLQNILCVAAMVIPPWNVFWWGVGAAYYYLLGGKGNDLDGDDYLYFVKLAPINWPRLPFMLLADRREKKRREAEQEWRLTAVRRTRAVLEGDGIVVTGWGEDSRGIILKAVVPPDKVGVFQGIIAAAAHVFCRDGGISPADFLRRISPPALLDRAWAERHGLGVYHEEVFFTCPDCGAQRSVGFFPNTEPRLSSRWEYTFNDGSRRIIDGELCLECLDKTSGCRMRRPV